MPIVLRALGTLRNKAPAQLFTTLIDLFAIFDLNLELASLRARQSKNINRVESF
jgi:hypothetical protein